MPREPLALPHTLGRSVRIVRTVTSEVAKIPGILWNLCETCDQITRKQTDPRNVESHDSIKDALQSAAREIRHWQLAGKALATLPAPGSTIPTREENTITLQGT